MKCINHSEADAVGACVICGKGLCADCKREIGMKLYCQTCARKRLSQKTVPPAPVANGEKVLEVGNDLPRIEEHDKASKLYPAAIFCSALAILSVLVGGSILFFNSVSFEPDHRLNTIIVSLIIILNLLAVILGVVFRRRNPTLAGRSDTKAGLLLNAIFLVLFILIGLLTI